MSTHLSTIHMPPKSSSQDRRTRSRTIAVAIAAITILIGLASTAQAHGRDFEEQPYEAPLFYGDFDEEVVLFAGATVEEVCNGIITTTPARVFTRRDGTVVLRVNNLRWPVYLYSSPLGAPELIDANCEAMFDDDPSTVPVEPFATGEGRVRVREVIAPDGNVHVVNSTVGSASAPDGSTWRFRSWADLMIVDGVPVGDPADFQGLRIRQTR